MPKFSVTYETWSPDDIAAGDTDTRGFIAQGVSLRDAIREVGGFAPEPSASRISEARWFTHHAYDEDYRTGAVEARSLHVPDSVTDASRRRIARLLGCRVPRI